MSIPARLRGNLEALESVKAVDPLTVEFKLKYAFGPFLQSHGGDLLNAAGPKANGTLNGKAGVEFGNWWQSLFTRKLTPGTSQSGADREAEREASACASAAGVPSVRATRFFCICTGSTPSPIPSASKIGPNSAMDWLARVTICLAIGARSSL